MSAEWLPTLDHLGWVNVAAITQILITGPVTSSRWVRSTEWRVSVKTAGIFEAVHEAKTEDDAKNWALALMIGGPM